MANRKKASHSHLKVVKGGDSAVERLFSGRVTAKPKSKGRKKEQPPMELPKNLQKYADVFAAGRAIEKEVKLKADFARQQIEDYCIDEIARRYAAVSRRPSSRSFTSKHSRFKFVFTERTTLTPEKTDELKEMNIPIEEYTETRGIQINYDAIRQHQLEDKLRDALESMHLKSAILEEIFTPQVQLKESFYDTLAEVVRNSLGQGENLEEKIRQTIQVLNPATQIRNVELVGLSAKQSFDLVNDTEIEAEDEIA